MTSANMPISGESVNLPIAIPRGLRHGWVPVTEAGDPLSARELEVVGLVVDGCSNAEIAERLHITLRTAQAHVAKAMRKLGAASRTQLAVTALRRGFVPLHSDESED